MRIITWNCHKGLTDQKADALAVQQPDIAVLPESVEGFTWPQSHERQPTDSDWSGQPGELGLGIWTFGDYRFAESVHTQRVPWVTPVEIDGPMPLLLLAIWTISRTGWPTYDQQVAEAIDAYSHELREGRAVLTGDLNCCPQIADKRKRQGHMDNMASLFDLGMHSAIHEARSIDHGDESDGTLYWQWSRESPFHCDLTFVPSGWLNNLSRAEVGTFEQWVETRLSDHVPVTVEFSSP